MERKIKEMKYLRRKGYSAERKERNQKERKENGSKRKIIE